MDWFYSIVSFGYYYCCGEKPIRPRRFQRCALVLTNCRLMSVYIYQRAGKIPTNYMNFVYHVARYELTIVLTYVISPIMLLRGFNLSTLILLIAISPEILKVDTQCAMDKIEFIAQFYPMVDV